MLERAAGADHIRAALAPGVAVVDALPDTLADNLAVKGWAVR